MASIKDIVFDSPHPASTARFWAQALDDYEVAPYDEEELTRLRSLGINDPEDDPTVLLVGTDDRLPRIFFQLVPEDKRAKNRVHLDLSTTDAAAEVKRLCALEATSGRARGLDHDAGPRWQRVLHHALVSGGQPSTSSKALPVLITSVVNTDRA
ncbi:VOC family protein [Streptomyces sp. NPDC053780]|uniref:VOC family protein n=1 Tax=unclassified Streptomyces TaxID=2593676 RepID=UPI00342D0F9E